MKELKNFNNKFKFHSNDHKFTSKNFKAKNLDEEMVSFKEVKKQREHKQYRNYENALRSKNLDRLLSYEDD